VDLRDVVNALPFIASTGCQWRMLLKSIRVGYVTVSRLRAAGTAIRRSKPPPQSLRRLRLHDKHGALPLRGFALASCTPQALERSRACALVVASALALLMVGCNQETKTEPPLPRPVRTVTVEKGAIGDAVQLTGDIRAENEVNLAFRIGGRIIERKGEVGDKVEPDQVLAKLDPQDELNTLRSAQAALNAARGQDVEAQNTFDRQNHLMERGFTTRANFDSAKQALQTAQARVDDATAQLDIAQDRVGFTELKANVEGTITARSAESGQVIQAGQPIFTIARTDGRDAVFDVPAQVLRAAPADATITIALANDPSVTAKARVRTVSPQADPVTRTFQVRLSLIDHPEAMRLGATVTGRLQLESDNGISIPASALTATDAKPAVWVVDPQNLTVALRNVEVERFDPATVVIASGLEPGDIVVTAGVQALHPGQKVRLLGATS
jgi:membrane fusion protein, multidrug efflux system